MIPTQGENAIMTLTLVTSTVSYSEHIDLQTRSKINWNQLILYFHMICTGPAFFVVARTHKLFVSQLPFENLNFTKLILKVLVYKVEY